MKTVFTIGLSIFAASTFSGYPFEPNQFMLLEMFVIGISSFLLAIEPNNKRIEGTFLRKVLIKSVPNALVMFIPTITLILLTELYVKGISSEIRNSIAMLIVTTVGFTNLLSLCRPFTKWRVGVCSIVGAGIITVSLITIALGDLIGILPAFTNPKFFFGMLGLSIAMAMILHLYLPNIEVVFDKLVAKIEEKKASKKKS